MNFCIVSKTVQLYGSPGTHCSPKKSSSDENCISQKQLYRLFYYGYIPIKEIKTIPIDELVANLSRSSGASVVNEPGLFEVTKSSSQVTHPDAAKGSPDLKYLTDLHCTYAQLLDEKLINDRTGSK